MKYTLENRSTLLLLQLGDKIELKTQFRQTTFTVRSNKFSAHESSVNYFYALFGHAYENFIIHSNCPYSHRTGPTFKTYHSATIIAHKLFDLCNLNEPAFDTTMIVEAVPTIDLIHCEISGEALNEIYDAACFDWKEIIRSHFPLHDFRHQSGFKIGSFVQTDQFKGCRLFDAGSFSSSEGNVFIVRDNTVVKLITVKDKMNINSAEIEQSDVTFKSLVQFSVDQNLLLKGYNKASARLKLLLKLRIFSLDHHKLYSVGDKVDQYKIVKYGDDHVALLKGTAISHITQQDANVPFKILIFMPFINLRSTVF